MWGGRFLLLAWHVIFTHHTSPPLPSFSPLPPPPPLLRTFRFSNIFTDSLVVSIILFCVLKDLKELSDLKIKISPEIVTFILENLHYFEIFDFYYINWPFLLFLQLNLGADICPMPILIYNKMIKTSGANIRENSGKLKRPIPPSPSNSCSFTWGGDEALIAPCNLEGLVPYVFCCRQLKFSIIHHSSHFL